MYKERNIPVRTVGEIYDRLERALDETPVFIGGRAVNILCSKDARMTNDIDLVIRNDPESKTAKLIEEGFLIERNKHGKITALEDRVNGVKIDLYYSRPINNIDIDDILKNSVLVNLKGETFRVVSPAILIIMKIDSGREQDIRDVDVLLEKFYKSDIEHFVNSEKQTLDNLGIDSYKQVCLKIGCIYKQIVCK